MCQIGGGHRKNGQKCVDLMWNDPSALIIRGHYQTLLHTLALPGDGGCVQFPEKNINWHHTPGIFYFIGFLNNLVKLFLVTA